MADLLDDHIDLLRSIRDDLKRAETAMSIPRPDRAKTIIEGTLPKMDRLWGIMEQEHNERKTR